MESRDGRPCFVLVAGPNGAGKSTIAKALLLDQLAIERYLNPDTVAAGLSAFAPLSAAESAARSVLREFDRLVAKRTSFAIETTLASRTYAPRLRGPLGGFYRHILFLYLDSADLAVRPVHHRVAAGGHLIPEPVVRRRYHRGLTNFFQLYRPLVDSWQVLDNTGRQPRRIASRSEGRLSVQNEAAWAGLESTYA